MKSASFLDAESLFNMKNYSGGNAGKKQKNSVILVCLMISVHHSLKIIQDMEMGVALINLFKNAILGKNVDKAAFGNNLIKLKEETRIVKRRTLSKEEIDFHLLMALASHDHPRKKSDQLSSLLGAVVKRCMDPTFHDKFQVKKMYT